MTSFTFGTPTTSASAFGTATTTSAFSFGKPATSTTSAFSFGTPASSAATGASTGLFGAVKPTTTTTTSAFSFGGGLGTTGSVFGAKPTGTTSFGTGTTSFGSSFGTGLGSSGFGTGLGTTTGFGTSGFGTGSGTTGLGTGTTGFGTTGLGTSGLGTGLNTGLGASAFGTTAQTGTLGFGQQATGINQAAISPMVLINLALSNPQIHGDERDGIIARLNQLQAYWGTGKGYYNQQGAAVDFSRENPYCRFKVVGYSKLPSSSNDDGFVGIQIKKKESEVLQHQQNLVSELQKCLGNKPTIMVCVDGLKPLPDNSTEVVFKVVERADNGMTKTYPSIDVYNALNQANVKVQLQNLGVTNITAKTNMSADLLQQYLNTPPAGIDSLLWEQAKRDNPDPQMLIPVPITGFDELKKRIEFEDQETAQHQKRLAIISEEIATLQCNHATTMAKLAQFKRKHLELSHRVLQVMVKQESIRKAGYSVQAEEEHLRVHLESLQAELNAPLQFKARLNELLSQIRLQQSQGVGGDRSEGRYTMDLSLQNELKQHLEQQQEGIMHLISILKEDMEDLKTIEQGIGQSLVVR